MLGKLIKYDFKAEFRQFAGAYIFLVVTAIIASLCDFFGADGSANIILNTLTFLSQILIVIGLIAIYVLTLVICILRYRSNLLKDEGYLMHTLPVKKWQLYFSKYITTAVWYVADIIVTIVCLCILNRDVSWIGEIAGEILGSKNVIGAGNFYMLAALVSFCVVAGAFASISELFFALNLGYSFGSGKANKDVIAVLAFVGEYIIMQVLSLVIVLQTAIKLDNSTVNMSSSVVINEANFSTNETMEMTVEVLSELMLRAGIFSAVVLVVLTVGSIVLMNKKLNIE